MRESRRSLEITLPSGLNTEAEVVIWLPDMGEKKHYQVCMKIQETEFTGASGRGVFFALQDLRKSLEPMNIWLNCYGAKEDVYPTPMMESSGDSLIAIRHEMGKPTNERDIIDIFDNDDSKERSTVVGQENFIREWLASLRKRPDA